MGYDTNPKYSPDGRYIAWLSMERGWYESDWNRLFIMIYKPVRNVLLVKHWIPI